MDPVPTFNWIFEYKSMAVNISTQHSRYERAESNLLADEKGSKHLIQLYLIYTSILIDLLATA